MKTIKLPFQYALSIGFTRKQRQTKAQYVEQVFRNIRKREEAELKTMLTECLCQCLTDTSL
jgi:hypothetical protein